MLTNLQVIKTELANKDISQEKLFTNSM